MDLMKRDNTLQTLRYLLDGGLDTRYNKINHLFDNFMNDIILHKLLDGWYIGTLYHKLIMLKNLILEIWKPR